MAENKKNFKNKDGIEKRTVNVKFINKTTKGGRRSRYSALVIAGDKKGRVGWGKGKSIEISTAVSKAEKNAIKNMVSVKIKKNGGLYHDMFIKKGVTKLLFKTLPVGSGIISGGVTRTILELAGYKDVCTKNLGNSSAINVAQATIEGLATQKEPKQIAAERGIEWSDWCKERKIPGSSSKKEE